MVLRMKLRDLEIHRKGGGSMSTAVEPGSVSHKPGNTGALVQLLPKSFQRSTALPKFGSLTSCLGGSHTVSPNGILMKNPFMAF